ncbi:MAG: hypothetical protein HRU09_09820 [Oligoflexales bacterium]|nr:hypothetical protein [Oligoflexales bacterium]
MDGVRAASLGVMTTYLLSFSGSIFKTCYDYALGKFDQEIFESIDEKIENRIDQLDQALEDRTKQFDEAFEDRTKQFDEAFEDRTKQLDEALGERIDQIDKSAFGGFLHTIVKGNTQGQ